MLGRLRIALAEGEPHAVLDLLRDHQQPALAADADDMAHFRIRAELARPGGDILAGGDEPGERLGQLLAQLRVADVGREAEILETRSRARVSRPELTR